MIIDDKIINSLIKLAQGLRQLGIQNEYGAVTYQIGLVELFQTFDGEGNAKVDEIQLPVNKEYQKGVAHPRLGPENCDSIFQGSHD
jgi:hypothetical protein